LQRSTAFLTITFHVFFFSFVLSFFLFLSFFSFVRILSFFLSFFFPF